MSFLFGQPKLTEGELSTCLNWLGQQYELTFVQDHEAELYNNALLADLNSITTSPASAKKVMDAVNRLVRVAELLVVQHARMQPVPDVAASDHYAWGLVFLQWKAWAIASRAALEATSKGSSFNTSYVQGQLQEVNNLRQKAEKEEGKLLKVLKRSGASMADIQKLVNEASQHISKSE